MSDFKKENSHGHKEQGHNKGAEHTQQPKKHGSEQNKGTHGGQQQGHGSEKERTEGTKQNHVPKHTK